MRNTIVAVCLLLCLGVAHARLTAAGCNEKCRRACSNIPSCPRSRSSQAQDNKDNKGNGNNGNNGNNDNKGNDNKDNKGIINDAWKKFCDEGKSCTGCLLDYNSFCDAAACRGPPSQDLLKTATARTDISWDSCRFTLVSRQCKSECNGDCKSACGGNPARATCTLEAGKAVWKITSNGACTGPVYTPPARKCDEGPPTSKADSTITYNWNGCRELTVGGACTTTVTCSPGTTTAAATATCTDQPAPKWVVTDACSAAIPPPQTCTAVPVLANTTFPNGCATTINTQCLATGCTSGFTPFPSVTSLPVATCTSNNGWTFSGACVGPAALKLELVGSSPVATGATITLKATLTQANAGVSGRTVALGTAAGTNVVFSCQALTLTTDASGVVSFTCTVTQLSPPVAGQLAPLLATIVFAATAAPTVGTPVTSPTLNVAVAGALCGGVTGTGTTAYYEGFEPPLLASSVTGAISAQSLAGAYQGGNVGRITATGAGSLWGSPNPITFPAAGRLVTQVAVFLDPTASTYTNGLLFTYTVGLNKAGTPTKSREFFFTIGWYDAASSGLTPQNKTFWVTAGDSIQDPTTSLSNRVSITQPGWYYLQVAYERQACQSGFNYPTNSVCVVAQMGVFRASLGGSCGSVVAAPNSWRVLPRLYVQSHTSDLAADAGGPSPGLFYFFQSSPSLSVDAFSYTSFST
ncbi:hypothetical protein OEZ86_009632 [Tetradesmus obliquus]|uniref:Ig-like domain-containing protein n=1 Tax=Tetradesmus obliquus TaxID=3088 RepID=A0ABY8UN31_TETOB|nr:hypothetical protein OEZ85_001075 [Tetradesmus obliquus]WIA43113.1 hypothetical protein OEZ86_009632 [Tetradesmus obliquus]